jgi:long-subunit acyl-CoA synthetase (AMP-forming)
VGEARGGFAALLTLEPDAAARFAVERALPVEPSRFIEQSVVRGWIARRVDQVNRELGEDERIVSFGVLPEPFSIAGGELSSSGELRREAIRERHAQRIAELGATAGVRPRPLTA